MSLLTDVAVDFTEVDLALNGSFEHSVKAEQDLHIINTIKEVCYRLLNATEPQLIMYEGSMGSGKSTVTTVTNNKLLELTELTGKLKPVILRLNDKRAPDDQIYIRNEIALNPNSQVKLFDFGLGLLEAYRIIEHMEPGQVLFISEAQFLGNIEDIQWVIDFAMNEGIHVVCDCLSVYYNGRRVVESEYIAQRSRKYYYRAMFPCDTFGEGRGEIPMRVVRIDENGDMPDQKDRESAKYYMSLTRERRREIFLAMENSEFAERLLRYENGKKVYLIPSHPSKDDSFVEGGNERYFSTSIETCTSILDSVGLTDVAQEYRDIKSQNGVHEA